MSQVARGAGDASIISIAMRRRLANVGRYRRLPREALALFFLFAVGAVQAAERSGSWSDEGKSWVLNQRGRPAISALFRASEPLPQSARVTSVYWQYTLTRKALPSGVEIRLCTSVRCMQLRGGKGISQAFNGDWAGHGFYFSFVLPGKGPITPPVRIRKSQLIVNYQY
ncbi:flagellar protein FlhE [Brenneria populi]|uniref:Flagellar protein FlhE n=1 Tax=Brenneria populi TaxID=1505588 RepID=A0ABU6JW36_9GAMM|nr:flagellar protein FlhE [Brenneria populi Li et al. 2015]